MTAALLPAFVHKILCGRRLDALRDRAELTQEQVARACGWSQPQVVNLETGTTGQRPEQLAKLRPLLKPTDQEWAEIVEHARIGRTPLPKRGFRFKFKGDRMRKVVDMEGSATIMRSHNSMTIPGLLQTEPYMRGIFEAYRPANGPEEIERLTALRLRRQEVLDNLDQRFEFVIDQAALSRMNNMAGGSNVMRGQLFHLLDTIGRPNVDLRFVPFTHGYYLGQAENYSLFEYDVEPRVRVVYVEQYDDQDILHDGKNVAKYLTLWQEQARAALDPSQAHNFLSFLAGPRS
jgi:transcriptional regulator with XRE-family HTH domain